MRSFFKGKSILLLGFSGILIGLKHIFYPENPTLSGAICFAAVLGIVILSALPYKKRRELSLFYLACLLLALSLASLFGHLSGLESLYGLAHFTRMSWPAALCFLAIALLAVGTLRKKIFYDIVGFSFLIGSLFSLIVFYLLTASHLATSIFPWLSFIMIYVLAFGVTTYIRRGRETRKLLVMQKKNLEQMNQDLEEFTHLVSHELRSPLNLLRDAVVQVQEERLGSLNAEQKKFLDITVRAIRRLVSTTTDILDLAKIENRKMHLHKQRFDLIRLAEDLADSFRLSAADKKIELRTHFSAPELPVYADEAKISRVLINFLTNALKYVEKGFIELRILLHSDKAVEVSVVDSGIGIPAPFLPRVFSKFEQFAATRSQRDLGTGLGLALSKEIIELHGGSVGVESELGKGSRFYFVLPMNTKGGE